MEKIHEFLHGMQHHVGDRHKASKARSSNSGKADYGQDVPMFTLLFFILGLVFTGLAAGAAWLFVAAQPILAVVLAVLLGLIGLAGLVGGTFLVWASRAGKYRMRDQVIASLPWRGDERVLDVGCGAGLLLIGAAKRLTTGKAVGLDIWDRNLEYGSTPENVFANASAEGVAGRVEVKDGDACQMPFPDETFDVVTSSNMLHHLSLEKRDRAIREMARVLKPGGRLVIAEIAFTGQFVQTLQSDGLREIEDAPLNMVLWRKVSARK